MVSSRPVDWVITSGDYSVMVTACAEAQARRVGCDQLADLYAVVVDAQDVVAQLAFDPMSPDSLPYLVARVSAYVRIPVEQIHGRQKAPQLVATRMAIAYMARELTVCSYPQIGEAMNRSQGHVFNLVRSAKQRLAEDEEFTQWVDRLKRLFPAG